mmetsp:Transcript_7680/g.10218  ORF Transcript_7680/g.10218 Transcript_7680/m.10218 type:complete len:305 (+) Transcript_7680:301-1215(+)|eukprot:CAMPEP_0117790578 /NCGR_PEP_ID=MMETSP0948-20121206/8341_1 /TAXON_ID=44440 /ORGANISM="Chattonella subsalsa, Strain CCMP2191" /LENGTH=304 /DNA_ID=CAMNT_0005620459 /DNA_START=207 /DNA_END=1121 /DNA_ORIENTATION=-
MGNEASHHANSSMDDRCYCPRKLSHQQSFHVVSLKARKGFRGFNRAVGKIVGKSRMRVISDGTATEEEKKAAALNIWKTRERRTGVTGQDILKEAQHIVTARKKDLKGASELLAVNEKDLERQPKTKLEHVHRNSTAMLLPVNKEEPPETNNCFAEEEKDEPKVTAPLSTINSAKGSPRKYLSLVSRTPRQISHDYYDYRSPRRAAISHHYKGSNDNSTTSRSAVIKNNSSIQTNTMAINHDQIIGQTFVQDIGRKTHSCNNMGKSYNHESSHSSHNSNDIGIKSRSCNNVGRFQNHHDNYLNN